MDYRPLFCLGKERGSDGRIGSEGVEGSVECSISSLVDDKWR